MPNLWHPQRAVLHDEGAEAQGLHVARPKMNMVAEWGSDPKSASRGLSLEESKGARLCLVGLTATSAHLLQPFLRAGGHLLTGVLVLQESRNAFCFWGFLDVSFELTLVSEDPKCHCGSPVKVGVHCGWGIDSSHPTPFQGPTLCLCPQLPRKMTAELISPSQSGQVHRGDPVTVPWDPPV